MHVLNDSRVLAIVASLSIALVVIVLLREHALTGRMSE